MAKFSLNPLRWFRRKPPVGEASPTAHEPLLKPPAQPRKSGNLFMQLITLQKNNQSMELIVKQHIDTTWLVQRTSSQLATLRQEAQMVGEDELAQAAGQLSAYFETVSEGRLVFTEEGVGLVRDFVAIFKDAIGDAAPGVRALDHEKLEAWNSRYQLLMAQMKPIEETQGAGKDTALKPELSRDSGPDDGDVRAALHGAGKQRSENGSGKSAVKGIRNPVLDDLVTDTPDFNFLTAEDFAPSQQTPSAEPHVEETPTASPALDSLPPYDPSEEARVRDIVISDSETKSARERLDLTGAMPFPDVREESADIHQSEASGADPSKPVKSAVQLEEVERLKKKLFELHEEQETLSWKMSGILGGLKKAVKSDQPASEEQTSPGALDTREMEDIIFVGRKKG